MFFAKTKLDNVYLLHVRKILGLLVLFSYGIGEQFGFARSRMNEFTLQAKVDVSMIWSIRCWVLLSLPSC